MYIKNSDLQNFADDITISCVSGSLNELISELEKEGNKQYSGLKITR